MMKLQIVSHPPSPFSLFEEEQRKLSENFKGDAQREPSGIDASPWSNRSFLVEDLDSNIEKETLSINPPLSYQNSSLFWSDASLWNINSSIIEPQANATSVNFYYFSHYERWL